MLVSQYLEDWRALHWPEIRPRTRESYDHLLSRYVLPALGALPLEELTPEAVRHLLAGIAAEGHSRTSELVFVLLKCALAELEPCPMRRVKRPHHVQQSPEPWSDQQIAAYVAALADHRHGLALLLGVACGLRRGEICGLRWTDIDFDNGLLQISNQRYRLDSGEIVDGPPKSASSVRPVPVPVPLLARLKAARQLGGYVCGLTPSGLDAAHRALVRRLGLPYIPLHGLRHSFATSCVRHGGDMRSLQALLGHASYATTANRYTHPDINMRRNALDCAVAAWYT